MSVQTTVLEAPEETHEPCKYIPFFDNDITKWNTSHDEDDCKVDKGREFAANFINEETDEERPQNFTDTK